MVDEEDAVRAGVRELVRGAATAVDEQLRPASVTSRPCLLGQDDCCHDWLAFSDFRDSLSSGVEAFGTICKRRPADSTG